MQTMRIPLAVLAGAMIVLLPLAVLAGGGHDDGHSDLMIGGDSAGVGNLLIDYPFGERPVVRVSDSGAPDGLFTAVDPGFDRAEDDPDEGVYELPAGTEISLEIVAMDERIQLTMNNGVDGLGILAAPGDTYRIGLISDGVCDDGICTAGDVGESCDDNADCSTMSPDIHNHPEYQLQLISLLGDDPDRFAEGDVLFKLTNTDAAGYGDSPVYKLTLSNGHLPSPEFEDASDAKDMRRRAKCQSVVARSASKLVSDHYKRLGACMEALVAAEELGGSEKKVDKRCDLDPAGKGVVGRLAAAQAKAIAKIGKTCGEPNLDGASEPFTLRQVKNHLGMASCRTQELIGAAFNGSLAMLEEHFSGECEANVCEGGIHDGDSCTDDEDCSAEEDIEEALPCLVMSQASH